MQADVLHRRPDNGETTGLGREGVYLIGALPHEASDTFDRIGRLHVSMHRLRKGKQGEGVLFVLSQTSHSHSAIRHKPHDLSFQVLSMRSLRDASADRNSFFSSRYVFFTSPTMVPDGA